MHMCIVACYLVRRFLYFVFYSRCLFQIYPYLVLNDNQVARCRSEERVLQLLNLVNLSLFKDKASCANGNICSLGFYLYLQYIIIFIIYLLTIIYFISIIIFCYLCLQESCRRNLQFIVPRVVSVSPQMRLVEDNTSNFSLADIFKQVCSQLFIVCTH